MWGMRTFREWFGTVVKSFVDDVLMPPLGLLLGGVDFEDLFVSLSGQGYPSLAAAQEAGAPTLNYGLFINKVISFLIVAFAVFLMVRSYNRLREERESVPAAPTDRECPFCRFRIPVAATRCAQCTSELA